MGDHSFLYFVVVLTVLVLMLLDTIDMMQRACPVDAYFESIL